MHDKRNPEFLRGSRNQCSTGDASRTVSLPSEYCQRAQLPPSNDLTLSCPPVIICANGIPKDSTVLLKKYGFRAIIDSCTDLQEPREMLCETLRMECQLPYI